MEAMAFGKPVITTRHVEIPRLVKQILVAENDVSGLADAIVQLYSSSSLRAKLGAKNREIAEQAFSPRNTAVKADIFRQLAGSVRERLDQSRAALESTATEGL
jgi:colanic acid/amylovoran biosynthesis glycosyltransferase